MTTPVPPGQVSSPPQPLATTAAQVAAQAADDEKLAEAKRAALGLAQIRHAVANSNTLKLSQSGGRDITSVWRSPANISETKLTVGRGAAPACLLVLITFDRLDCFHMKPGTQLNNLCTLVQRGFGYRSPSDEGVIPP